MKKKKSSMKKDSMIYDNDIIGDGLKAMGGGKSKGAGVIETGHKNLMGNNLSLDMGGLSGMSKKGKKGKMDYGY